MEKSPKDGEIDRILAEAVAIKEKAELDLNTALFFDNEATKLEAIVDNPKTLPEDKEQAMIKLAALYKRILIELNEEPTAIDEVEKDLNTFIKGLNEERS